MSAGVLQVTFQRGTNALHGVDGCGMVVPWLVLRPTQRTAQPPTYSDNSAKAHLVPAPMSHRRRRWW